MNRILLFVLALVIVSSCTEPKKKIVAYASDNPAERMAWEALRLKDPATGEVPRNMRKKEMIFAKTLPKSQAMSKSNWKLRGPYNVGGRTRALAFDVLDENTLLLYFYYLKELM